MTDATVDPRDAALRATCPVIGAPMFGPLPALNRGQRMILARDGLYLQFAGPWLSVTTKVGAVTPGLRLPYGPVQEGLAFAFGSIPVAMIEAFIAEARRAMPNEAAGALVYCIADGSLSLRMHEPLSRSAGHIRYRITELADDELLAVDLHTHGRLAAFWSDTDDRDDLGIRVCGVFGHLDRERPSARFRLVLNGVFVDLAHPWTSAG
jgi:PRTRC genetic system protein A